jgi:hypothetical protein
MSWMGLQGNNFPGGLASVKGNMPPLSQLSTSSADLQEYLLVARPSAEVHNKIVSEQENFCAEYEMSDAAVTKSHIVIASFSAKESMEETMIRWIRNICNRQKSFDVTLNNYSGIPSHSIYLRIMDHHPFLALAKELNVIDEFVRSNGCPRAHLVHRPHLSIALQLNERIYERAMLDYSQKLFCESFTVGELILLKRKDMYDTCRIINVFGLLPAENNLFN